METRKLKKPLLVVPHGPSEHIKGKYSPGGYISHWVEHPVNIPPGWNPLLLQNKATFKASFGGKKLTKTQKKRKEKTTKKLRKKAKKLGIKLTMKKGNKRVYKSDKTLRRHIKIKK